MIRRRKLLLSTLLLADLACSRQPATGPLEPKWDRAACEHCQMLISDRRHAAQLRVPGGRAHHFDDLGCALLWLDGSGLDGSRLESSGPEAKGAESGGRLELWVRDAEGRRWLDGWRTRYQSGLHSPMGYGFAPAAEGTADAVAIDLVRERLRALEASRRAPGG